MNKHIFVGFGFGPIQSGLFVSEAFKSGNFSRIVIAEIDQNLVDAVRNSNGSYYINIASNSGITAEKIDDIQTLNPTVAADREKLIEALSEATEIVTSLPSVNFYNTGEHSVASLINQGLTRSAAPATIIYTAENNNHAAEVLQEQVGSFKNVQFLNTVIGKMSQVINDKQEIEQKQLKTITPRINRAFLVEEFNRILVTQCNIDGFTPGIKTFVEKQDLLPFEHAKLFGHNTIHALLAYLGAAKGYKKMAELKNDSQIMQIATDAFINESGAALIKQYANLNDKLFTEPGFKEYANDLLERITNPYLDDPIERAARDPQRKLAQNDRLFGTMQLAFQHNIDPTNIAKAARAAIEYLLKHPKESRIPEELQLNNQEKTDDALIEKLLCWLWQDETNQYHNKIIRAVQTAPLSK